MPAIIFLLVRLGRSVWNGLKEPEFHGLFMLTVIVIVSGAWFFHVREGWSWLDSFYFTTDEYRQNFYNGVHLGWFEYHFQFHCIIGRIPTGWPIQTGSKAIWPDSSN